MPYGVYKRNRHKKPPRTKSGLRGVIFCSALQKKPWKAYIRQHGMYFTLGYFPTKEDAARRYNSEAMRIHGFDTYLNPV